MYSESKMITELLRKEQLITYKELIDIRKISRGDIYMIEIKDSKDSEQSGIRPAVIIQNDTGNKYSPTTIVAFITSRHKKDLPTHVSIHCKELSKRSTVMLEQIRTVSVKRLLRYVCTLNKQDMKRIDQALRVSFDCGRRKESVYGYKR